MRWIALRRIVVWWFRVVPSGGGRTTRRRLRRPFFLTGRRWLAHPAPKLGLRQLGIPVRYLPTVPLWLLLANFEDIELELLLAYRSMI